MIITVTGPMDDSQMGVTAGHEHIMVDFRDAGAPPMPYDAAEVVSVMEPYLIRLKQAGCETFVDCTPEGIGRDPLVLKELSTRTGLRILTNTGWYKAPYLPPQAYELDEGQIAAIWAAEAQQGIGDTGVRPGFIKIALNGDNPRPEPIQMKLLRAAALTSRATGLAIVCHTIGHVAATEAAAELERLGFDLSRFIWAHADTSKDMDVLTGLAGKGMWVSLDGINNDYDRQVAMIKLLAAQAMEGRILISQDSGWYTVGEPMGGAVRAYHTLFTSFIPYAEAHGVSRELLQRIVTRNPAEALRVREEGLHA